MAERLSIGGDGAFEVNGCTYQIPLQFSPREVFSYRRLLEPIPDTPGGTSLTDEQRKRQRAYLLRRAAACIIPGLQASTLESLSLRKLQLIHNWIWQHRPELSADGQLLSA